MLSLIMFLAFSVISVCYASNVDYYEQAEELRKVGKYREAEKYYKVSADRGNAQAQYNLGLIFYDKDQDFVEAKKYFQLAARQGVSEAQSRLEDRKLNEIQENKEKDSMDFIKYNKNIGHYFESEADTSSFNLNTKVLTEDDY